MATLTDTDPGMVGKGLNAVGGAINKTFDAVLPGYKTARLSGEEDLKQKQLETRIMQWQEKHNQALPYLARAKKRIQSGDLDGYIDDMKHVHNVFPDGEEILDKKKRADGVVVTIRNRDGTKRQELINYQTAQQDWEDAYAGMDPQAFLRTQSQLYAEREAFNRVQKQKPQETVDGTYAYQQMDNKGNFKWVEVDENGKERELKSKPKLLSEQTERRRADQDWRKGEADIAAKEASTQKDLADAEYTRGGKGRSKEPTESYPGEHSDKISKGIYENFGVTAGPDEDGNISSYNLDTKNAVDKDLASRGRIGLWKSRKKGWGGGIEYEFMGHTEGPKEGDVGTFGDDEGNIHEAVYKDGNWVKKEDGSEEKPEDIPEEVIERVEAAEPEEPPKQPEKAPVEEYQKETDTFTDGMLPMQAKRVNDAIDRSIRHNGKLTTRRAMVKALVDDGATIVEKNGERRLQRPNGNFLIEKDISKTAMDYADHLIKQKSRKQAIDKEINQVARWLRESPAKEKGQMERLTRAYDERTARQIIDSAKEINKSLKDTPHPWPAAAKEAGKDLLSAAQALSDRATPGFDPALGGARSTRSGTKKDWNMTAQK